VTPVAAPRSRRGRAEPRRLLRVISGGQTGVDRAALDAALACSIEIGGWCPRGRRAEDGRIDERYPLHETESGVYAERTRLNVRDADATLILSRGPLTGGTGLTRSFVQQRGCPLLVVNRDAPSPEDAAQRVRAWIEEYGIQVLNVAGPRESTSQGIYHWALSVLTAAFR
jgi:hypothetical protein